MSGSSELAKRLFQIESNDLAPGQGHWSLQAYESEIQSDAAKIYFWPSVDNFTAFVLYRVIDNSQAWIMNWATQKKGQGVGTQVFADFMKYARAEGLTAIGLEVRAGNKAALKIYEKFFLKFVGNRPSYYSNAEDALVLVGTL